MWFQVQLQPLVEVLEAEAQYFEARVEGWQRIEEKAEVQKNLLYLVVQEANSIGRLLGVHNGGIQPQFALFVCSLDDGTPQ
jgi:hypothetical protein